MLSGLVVITSALLICAPEPRAEQVLSQEETTVTATKRIGTLTFEIGATNDVKTTVHFFRVLTDSDGTVLKSEHIERLQISDAELRSYLPTNGIPDFDTMFEGLSQLFHSVSQAQGP